MPEYINHNGYTVHLTGPDGRIIRLAAQQRMVLPAFFEIYRNRGMIKLSSEANRLSAAQQERNRLAPIQQKQNRSDRKKDLPRLEKPPQKDHPIMPGRRPEHRTVTPDVRREYFLQRVKNSDNKPVVGKQVRGDATEALKNQLEINSYAISNDIAVGVLSYNRATSLRRCIASIVQHTNLLKTTLFISDDASTDPETLKLLDDLTANRNIVVIRNAARLGIAGNTNRLLRCMQRFKYAFLVNDDIEILADGWERIYTDAMAKSGLVHLIHRQPEVYGARIGKPEQIKTASLLKTDDKPQGAMLVLDTKCLSSVGYFDESFGLYGMEHVDWSTKVFEARLQPKGFFDVAGSLEYIKLHSEQSAVDGRVKLLADARQKFEKRSGRAVHPTEASAVPGLSVVIPYRELQRNQSLLTVINNMKALRVPCVQIVLVEQDSETRLSGVDLSTIDYHFVPNGEKTLFNKSKAFNKGVQKSIHDIVLLHDADILVSTTYGKDLLELFKTKNACHIGQTVIYANPEGTQQINDHQEVRSVPCDRIVGYFEGGSLAARKSVYWSVGGFNEDFYGYGCEDCDFFARLSSVSDFYNDRYHKFVHLWHPRADNWGEHHDINRAIERKLCATPMHERIKKLQPIVETYNENTNLP